MNRFQIQNIVFKTMAYAVMVIIAAVMVLPFLWMLSTALKAPSEVFTIPLQWLPAKPVWRNFIDVFYEIPYAKFYMNTVTVTSINLVGTLFFSSLAAYAFARLKFPGSGLMFGLLLGSLMIPYTVRVIPLFALFQSWGWIDTHLPLTVPTIFSNAFGIFLLRQFFMTIPYDLEDAARIDGCSSFMIYRKIMLPLCKPALAAVGIFKFMEDWNAFLAPLIFINSRSKQLLSVGLSMFQDDLGTEWTLLMAASAMAILPVVLVFIFAQKYFIEGITFSGMKT